MEQQGTGTIVGILLEKGIILAANIGEETQRIYEIGERLTCAVAGDVPDVVECVKRLTEAYQQMKEKHNNHFLVEDLISCFIEYIGKREENNPRPEADLLIAGWDEERMPKLFAVDATEQTSKRIEKCSCMGSQSRIASRILKYPHIRENMSKYEAATTARIAISTASTFNQATGGSMRVVHIGRKRVKELQTIPIKDFQENNFFVTPSGEIKLIRYF